MTDTDGAGVDANVDEALRMSTRRPRFHFTPPRGWLNDPCAPYQDPKTGMYHLSYQWVPGSTEWTHEIGWGHATTSDLLHWQADGEPALMPEVEEEGYDVMGVFTGNIDMRSVGTGTERLVAVYSCINERAKLQRSEGYQQGQERLAVATSSDGTVWTKDTRNPLPVEPPSDVTGWRDPYMFSSPALDSLLQNDSATYCLVSGGINGLGPTIFLYTLPSSVPGEDLEDSLAKQWTYLGPLIGPPTREWPRSRWVGDIGLNWECAGMFTLPAPSPLPSHVDQTVAAVRQGERQWVILGSEGKYTHSLSGVLPGEEDEGKSPMWQLWYAGTLSSKGKDAKATGAARAAASQEGNDGVRLDIELEGVLDWGCLYATQTFLCNDGRRLMWGWLPDDDLTPDARAAQGWAGAMSLPRELFTWEQTDVLRALVTPLSDLPNFESESLPLAAPLTPCAVEQDRYVVRTLGMRVAKEIEAARSQEMNLLGVGVEPSDAWEVELLGDVAESDVKEIGFRLAFAHGSAEIVFLPSSELLLVRRSQSNKPPSQQRTHHINTSPIHGAHTLFQTSSSGWEPLRLRAFWDGTILEVFANDRFAISTHLYGGECAPSVIVRDGRGTVGLSPPSSGTGAGSLKARVWQYQ